jgi:hypothetical protein
MNSSVLGSRAGPLPIMSGGRPDISSGLSLMLGRPDRAAIDAGSGSERKMPCEADEVAESLRELDVTGDDEDDGALAEKKGGETKVVEVDEWPLALE